jgi:hypothetical protein
MMQKQSLDFIKGYVFSKVESRIQQVHASKLQKMTPVPQKKKAVLLPAGAYWNY